MTPSISMEKVVVSAKTLAAPIPSREATWRADIARPQGGTPPPPLVAHPPPPQGMAPPPEAAQPWPPPEAAWPCLPFIPGRLPTLEEYLFCHSESGEETTTEAEQSPETTTTVATESLPSSEPASDAEYPTFWGMGVGDWGIFIALSLVILLVPQSGWIGGWLADRFHRPPAPGTGGPGSSSPAIPTGISGSEGPGGASAPAIPAGPMAALPPSVGLSATAGGTNPRPHDPPPSPFSSAASKADSSSALS